MTDMITLDQVTKHFGSFVALRPTDLKVRDGEFLTLLGPSGSGKSTLLNLIAGSTAPSDGRILIGSDDVTLRPARKRGIGMVFQNYALMPHLTVYDNIAYPLVVRKMPRKDIAEKVRDVIDRVGLSGFEARKPRQLSGGQQQRVGIARCIVYSPRMILMDEPLGALDKNMRDQMQEEIKRLHLELGTTILYVTHDQEEALNLSDRICLMNKGGIEQIGTPAELYFAPQTRFTAEFIGESNIFIAKDVAADGTIRTAEGAIMQLPGARIRAEDRLMIRPERVSLGAAAAVGQVNSTCATLEMISFFGGMTRLTLRTPSGAVLHARQVSGTGGAPHAAGEVMSVNWVPSDVVVLPC